MKNNTIIIAVIAIIIIGAIVMWGKKQNDEMSNQGKYGQESSNTINNEDGAGPSGATGESVTIIREKVMGFGKVMKLVSTVAADYKSQIQTQYGIYVTPDLIAKWKAEPALALASNAKNPLPDRIEITNITKVSDDKYTITGNVIEIGADSIKTVGSYPVTITVENERGVWLITGATKGAYIKSSL